MIVLPANYTTNMAAGYPVVYVIRFLGGTAYTFASRSGLTITSGGTTITPVYTDYFAIQVDGSPTEFIGEIDCSIDLSRGGAVAGMNETSLVFLNQSRFDTFVSTFDLEHRRIKIYEGFIAPAGTIDIVDDMVQIYDGVVQDADQWDYRTFRIPCKDRRVVDDKPMPKKLIYSDDFPDAPEDNYRKAIPYVAFGISAMDEWDKEKMFLPAVQTNKTLSTTASYLDFRYADDNFVSTKAVYADENLYGEFINPTFVHNMDESYVRLLNGDCYFYIIPDGTHGNSTAGLSIDNAIDGNLATYLTIGSEQQFWFRISKKNSSPGRLYGSAFTSYTGTTDIEFYFYVETVSLGVSPKMYYAIGRTGESVEMTQSYSHLVDLSWGNGITRAGWCHTAPIVNVTGSDSAGSDFTDVYEIRFSINCPAGASINISEVYFKVKAEVEDFSRTIPVTQSNDNFMGGRSFGSARTGRGGWRRQTGSSYSVELGSNVYVDGLNYGLSIYSCPSKIVKSILDAQCGVPTFVIENTDANTARASWASQFSATERIGAFDLIQKICSEHSLGMWIDLTGTYLIFPLDTGDTDFALTSTDIALDSQGIPRISISRTSSRDLVNDMHVSYGYSHVFRKHMKNVYIGDIDGNSAITTNLTSETGAPLGTTYTGMMNNSITKYRVKNTAEYNFDTIIDTTTAESAIKKLADWLAYKKLVIKLDVVRNANTLTLRIGDIVTLNTTILSDEIVSNVKYFVTGINFPAVGYQVQPYFTLTLTEIPSAYMDYKGIDSIPDMDEYTTAVA